MSVNAEVHGAPPLGSDWRESEGLICVFGGTVFLVLSRPQGQSLTRACCTEYIAASFSPCVLIPALGIQARNFHGVSNLDVLSP